jgi:5-oxoprolinase (ATP-hydrolysing)
MKPWGVNGGSPGSRSRKGIFRENSYGTDKPVHEILPSKADHIRVKPGDVLEWITWGGGGLGDPLTRPAEIVAKEVHRKLVTVEGAAKNYGVVIRGKDFTVNEGATQELREKIRSLRSEEYSLVSYDRGGTIEELLASCKEETGLEPPKYQWESDPYGPHVALPYVQEWYKKMREQKGWVLEDVGKLDG